MAAQPVTASAWTPPVLSDELDADLRAFLTTTLNAVAPLPPSAIAPLARRKLFAAFAGSHAGEQEPIAATYDVSVPTPSGDLPLRVYVPQPAYVARKRPHDDGGSAATLSPMLLFCHGGGWHAGSITTHDGAVRRLANASGVIIASLNYRTAPEAAAPAPVHDTLAALEWLRGHAAEYGGDANRIGLAGDSAGGNIVAGAQVALCQRDGAHGVVGLFLIYPMVDLTASTGESYQRFAEGYYLRTVAVHRFVELYLGSDTLAAERLDITDPLVSPLRAGDAVLARFPPTVVFSAGHDPLLSDSEALEATLRRLGVPVRHQCYQPLIHAFLHLYNISPACDRALRDIGRVIGDALH